MEASEATGGSRDERTRRPARRRRPTIDERDAFILKLIDFRKGLAPREQRMLDALAVAAFCERPPDPVRGYADVTAADFRPGSETTPWMASYDHLPAPDQ